MISTGNLLRSGGVAAAGLLPGRRARVAALAGSYVAGWVAGPRGFQVVSLTGPEDGTPVLQDGIPLVTSTASWTASQLAVLAALRLLPLPRLLTVAAYAGALAVTEPRVLAAAERRAATPPARA